MIHYETEYNMFKVALVIACYAVCHIDSIASQRVYIGCFNDDPTRMFPFPNDPSFGNHGLTESDMSLNRCFRYCASNNYVYSGVQAATHCFCGNDYPNTDKFPKRENECNDPCPGDVSNKCGGENYRQSVYRDCSILMPNFPNCVNVCCDNTTCRGCTKCANDYLYKLDSSKQCKDKCSWNDRWCWPGRCPVEFTTSCQCMAGFKVVHTATKTQCQLATKPVLDSCLTKANGNRSYVLSNNGSPKCSAQSNMYGRFQIDNIELLNLNAYFHVSIDKTVSKPAYVKEYAFGITDVEVELKKVAVSGSTVGIGKSSVRKDHPFSTNPLADFSKTNFKIPISAHLSNNGEKICWQLKIKGGGYLQSKNVQNSSTRYIPYDKTETTRELCYIYDIKPPRHCIGMNSCTSDPLRLSSRLTRSQKIQVFFGGWSDSYPVNGSPSLASGIESYELSVYEMESSSTVLMRDRTVIGKPVIVNSTETSLEFDLPDKNPMVYAILLVVKDKANNVRQARRFVLYDNSSKLHLDDHKTILVITATKKTRFLWQVNHKQLCFSWKGRFYNDGYKRYNPLLPIKPEAYDAVKEYYEQISGSLSVNGTTNINGITGFDYSLYRNNVTKLSGRINDVTSESICLNSLKNDGDTFILNLQARDIMNNTLNDSAMVYIDRSVPEIQDVGITDRHQHKKLYVHYSKDLSTMSIQFRAYDIHSGLKEIKWAFGIHENKTILIEKALGVTNLDMGNCSMESKCYCPKIGKCALTTYIADLKKLKTYNRYIGDHNRRYFFTLKVTNKAELIAVDHLDILIDDSPPAVGVVLEGPIGSPDIDYTHSDEVTIHWHDFIDHESGIKLYKVALGRECYSQIKDFLTRKHDGVNIYETNHDSIKIKFQNGEGQYFVSIIAYNNAMTPSIVVCSDGITFDKTVPIIGNVSVKHSNIKETIACDSGTPWLITDILSKVKLQGDECRQICMNTTTDSILTILPKDIRSRANSETVSTFLCTKLDRYNQNTIFTPSDLFEISWNIQEDLSQIGNSYIGFGSDTNQLDHPALLNYINVPHPTQYIQHHPGLIGEQNIYIFIKVHNRAGLDTKVWFGPVIADETPPVCPSTVHAFLDNDTYVVINWTRSNLFDTEQIDEIGKIMFRFGTRNTFVTPFLAWNIKSHGGQCGSDYQCIKYPAHKLQKHDTFPNSLFYAQLHVYNYAGHYCTTESLKVQLPSLIPQRTGIVMDVLPNTNPPYFDTDIIFDTKYCFVLIGFDHHEDVHLQAGLGTSQNLDNVVPFHDITKNEDMFICERIENAERIEIYFVTIKSSWSGGYTYTSSDGFRVLNKTLVMSSFFVNHGDSCDDAAKKGSHYIQMTMNTSVNFLRETLNPSSVYSLYSNLKIQLVNSDLFVKGSQKSSKYFILKFVPLKAMKKLYIVLSNDIINATESLEITVYKCDTDQTVQSQKTLIQINWSLDRQYLKFVSHYLTAVCKSSHDQCKHNLMFTNSGNTSVHYFHENFTEGYYKAAVKPCFGQICLAHVFSKEFVVVRNLKRDQNIETTMIPSELCTNTTVTAAKFVCSNMDVIEYAIAYRWALFKDEQGHNMLSPWKIIRNQTWKGIEIRDHFCPELPVYSYTKLYVCIDSFCQSGAYYQTCSVVKALGDPNTFNKDILYDLNINSHFGNIIQAYKHSENIGEKLSELHDSEMDFAGQDVEIGGYILGKPDLPITWYLTRDSKTFGEKCAFDPHCLLSKNTIGGFVNFGNLKTVENGVLYICAKSSTMQKFCSDGFVIDENFPTGGVVSVEAINGFIIEGSTMSIHWTGFEGSKDALQLGYTSDMAGYKYAIGSSPGASDVLGFTTVGLETSVVATDILLRAGQIYFVTVRAYNHRNKTVDVYSDGVIYDNSPPTVGIIQVESSLLYVVTSYEISVKWNEIEDNESGIRKIEIGIGSSNRSADIIPFQEFENYGLISTNQCIQDGHRYFAILKATNGAGLSSFTVSSPFVIDATPPVGGHIMDVLDLDSKVDVDFQTETNFIRASWLGFRDPHSHVIYYKIGLGTSYGNDDVMKLTNVGLHTSKAWALSFSQGVTYYSTVEACNGAGLCSTATSNGILIDNSAPVPGLVFVGEPGKYTNFISDRNTIHASWIGFEDPHSGIDHFDICLGSSIDTCDVMKSLNVQLASSIIKTKLNMSVGVDYFVSVTACNHVNVCTKRSSPSFTVDNTPPVVIDKPRIFSIHQDNTTSRQIISDPSFFKVFWKFRDSESPIIKTILTIHSNLDSHKPVDDIFISNEGEFVVQLTKNNLLRQGDIYIVQITSCNAASMCTSAVSDEFLVDSTPPQMGGFRSPLEYEIQNVTNKLYLNLSWYGFFDVETDIRSYYISVGYTFSETQLVDGYKIVPTTTSDFQQSQIVANMSDSIMNYLVLTIWAENNAGIMTSQAKVTTDILPNNYDRSNGNLLIQMHSCDTYFCEDDCRCDCTCGVVGRKCLSDDRNSCKHLTSKITPIIIVNVSVRTDDPELSVVGSSRCLGSHWAYESNKHVIRFEYSFGIKGAAIGLGVFNLSSENVWYDVGRRTEAFHCLLKTQLTHKTLYVAYVKAWTSLDEYAIFESDPVIIDHTPPVIHKKHFVLDSLLSCDHDVDYITSNDSISACWMGVFSEDESYIKTIMVSLGTSQNVDDIVPMKDVGKTFNITWTDIKFQSGTRYYTTVRAVNSIGLQSEVSSDGFVIDDIPPVSGIVYNTKHHRDVIFQSSDEPVQFSWHGFDDEHSFIDSYFVAFYTKREHAVEILSKIFIPVGMSNHVLFADNIKHKDKITAYVKARDKAGHDSEVAMSQTIQIDATSPISFTCLNFQLFKHANFKANADSFEMSEALNGDVHDVFRIRIQINRPKIDFQSYLTIGDMSMLLPYAMNADGSAITEYEYMLHESGKPNASVIIAGTQHNTTVDFQISKCSNIKYELNRTEIISAQQISQDAISVCVQTVDLESGIKHINVGVGSIPNGFEIQSLYPLSSHLHQVITGSFSHGMNLYVKAEAENHAGLKTIFTSRSFVFDETPPHISHNRTTLEYLLTNNETLVMAKSSWYVIDDESQVIYCEYCIGSSSTSCDIVKMTHTSELTSFETKPFHANHGSNVFATIRCINKVQLTGYGHYGPSFVSYLPPDSTNSKIQFITDTSTNSLVQSNDHSITLHWDAFEDLSELKTYSAQLSHDSVTLLDWIDVQNKNYLRISGVGMKENQNYTVCVTGRNLGGKESKIISNSITVHKKRPVLTGKQVIIEHLNDNDYKVEWSGVFAELLEHYEVNIGSMEGSSDILMPISTTELSRNVYISKDINELRIVITGFSDTGMSETYRQTINLRQ